MTLTAPDERLYFRQLLSGRDFAQSDQLAHQMVNYVYAIGDRTTGDAVLVDPAYDPAALIEVLHSDGMTVRGVLASHYHADHIGGEILGFDIVGIVQLLSLIDVPVHVQQSEVAFIKETIGVDDSVLTVHEGSDTVTVGAIDVQCIHTPGHTPGSQCFLIGDAFVTGDTLFIDGCGRTDLPAGDAEQLYETLQHRLSSVAGSAQVYPGHAYAPQASASLTAVREHNAVLRPQLKSDWLMRFGS